MGNIRVIGPRSSGKTTYLAGLAYWPQNSSTANNQQFKITPLNEDTESLAYKAENLIVQGLQLEPTVVESIYDLTSYSFQIEVKPRFKSRQVFNLVAKDYPGEVFENMDKLTPSSLQEDLQADFMRECLDEDVEGCLVLLTDWDAKADKAYKRLFIQFLRAMERRDRTQNLRLAIAISKCERGELWPGRLYPEIDVFRAYLPETLALLRAKLPKKNLQFFALSTFGVLSRIDPRPNRIEMVGELSSKAVLRATKRDSWKPYGMIDPLYWLNTGNYVEFKS